MNDHATAARARQSPSTGGNQTAAYNASPQFT